MKKLLLILLSVALFSSCISEKKCQKKYPPETSTEVKTEIVEKTIHKIDTSYILNDTMSLKLLLECDSNNNVLIRELESEKGKTFKTKYIFKDNTLEIGTYLDSIAILKEVINKEKGKVKIEIKKEVVKEKYIPKIYKISLIISIVLFVLAIIWIIRFIRKIHL